MSKFYVTASAVLVLVLSGCTRTVYLPAGGVVEDGKYDTPLSHVGADAVFERAFAAIHFLNSVAFYRQLTFDRDANVGLDDLARGRPERLAASTAMYHRTASGTATVVHRTPSRVALITSAHVVAFPDTVLAYYEDNGRPTSIRSFAVKVRQSNYVPDIPGADRVEILAIDEVRDVAVLGQLIPDLPTGAIPVLEFPAGTVEDLQWGSEVFVFGFPAGTRMLTSGLVSKMLRDRRTVFLTDAAFNRGFSGGLVLAIRDGTDFEWVGIATSGAATTELTLGPPDAVPVAPEELEQPYDGPVVLRQQKRLRYGITTCTSVDVILDFLRENRASLARRGYLFNLGS